MAGEDRTRTVARGVRKFRAVYGAARGYYDDQERELADTEGKAGILEGCRAWWSKAEILEIAEVRVQLWGDLIEAIRGEMAIVWLPAPGRRKQITFPTSGLDRLKEVLRRVSLRLTDARFIARRLEEGRDPDAYKRIDDDALEKAEVILQHRRNISLAEALSAAERELQDARLLLEAAEIRKLLNEYE